MGNSPVATMETGFTAELGRRHADLFEAFYDHPFLAGMRDGTLAKEKVLHYVGQDHQYLSAYIRCYGLGLALSPDRGWMRHFHDSIAFVLDEESHPHQVLCEHAGTGYAEAQVGRLAPSAQAYVDHMMAAGRDSLGVLLASLLPCPWTYTWAADRFVRDERPGPDNPFLGWWTFYADPGCQSVTTELRSMLDSLAADAGAAERARMERAFEDSCHHEVRFWNMAWTLEEWSAPTGA
ncbi:thiaminase/transcriptional activator TenA [Spinactinospora alkalitolerans]|uniref:Thiaminase/transcriptional activator TenA n=1 Tax=Spinactinospora alkalitolerans TaxID=687207 RepID=A0A852U6B2_9ACTN|nr:TenA family protein [Spinactinospora alkalitolerans]NYE50413.1 thiaminase/transcriptional activator TenA [Spinactinospora alkalitolerans]